MERLCQIQYRCSANRRFPLSTAVLRVRIKELLGFSASLGKTVGPGEVLRRLGDWAAAGRRRLESGGGACRTTADGPAGDDGPPTTKKARREPVGQPGSASWAALVDVEGPLARAAGATQSGGSLDKGSPVPQRLPTPSFSQRAVSGTKIPPFLKTARVLGLQPLNQPRPHDLCYVPVRRPVPSLRPPWGRAVRPWRCT